VAVEELNLSRFIAEFRRVELLPPLETKSYLDHNTHHARTLTVPTCGHPDGELLKIPPKLAPDESVDGFAF
jgi:hypothetical protein